MTTGFGVLSSDDLRAEMDDRTREHLRAIRPEVSGRAVQLLSRCQRAGIRLCITQGYRSTEDQDRIFAKGRTVQSDVPCRHGSDTRKPGTCDEHPLGATVTKARGGHSWHNWGLAFDVAVLDDDGQPSWPEDDALWRRIGEIGEDLDLQWGGRFQRFPDRPHFQMTLGLSLALLENGDQELPPLERVEAPCLTASAGPTGAGPSTGDPGIPETARPSPLATGSSGSPTRSTSGPRTGKSL